jgi:hypothetical protein
MIEPTQNITALDFEVLISRCLCCKDLMGAAALDELAQRNSIPLNHKWINQRVTSQLGLWEVRRDTPHR